MSVLCFRCFPYGHKKILNNNAVVTVNETGREIVAIGKGIAFNHKVGDNVSDDVVQKIYILSDKNVLQKFEQLISGISIEYLQVTNEIIELAEKELDCKLSDFAYISLTDHIHMAVHRARRGVFLDNMMLWEIDKFYEREFLVAKRALNLINARFQVEMPEGEAGFIAMHLIDGQSESSVPLADKTMKLIQEIVNIVRMTCFRPSYSVFAFPKSYIVIRAVFCRRLLDESKCRPL